jgi:hypothetical protein
MEPPFRRQRTFVAHTFAAVAKQAAIRLNRSLGWNKRAGNYRDLVRGQPRLYATNR